jgi:uncharacterized protein
MAMRILARVRTKSKRPGVTKLDDAHFVVAVAEPPIEGKANRAVAQALAEHLGVSPSRVMLVSGRTSREKVFEVDE